MSTERFGPSIVFADLDDSTSWTLTGRHAPYPVPRTKYPTKIEAIDLQPGDEPGKCFAAIPAGLSEGEETFAVAALPAGMADWLEARGKSAAPIKISYEGGAALSWRVALVIGPECSNWTQDWHQQSGSFKVWFTGALR